MFRLTTSWPARPGALRRLSPSAPAPDPAALGPELEAALQITGPGTFAGTVLDATDGTVLYDRDGDAEFFQVYTHIFEERFFFEIVQRRNYQGFGAANAAIRLAAQAREVRPDTMPRL